jgi:hypothetical protein
MNSLESCMTRVQSPVQSLPQPDILDPFLGTGEKKTVDQDSIECTYLFRGQNFSYKFFLELKQFFISKSAMQDDFAKRKNAGIALIRSRQTTLGYIQKLRDKHSLNQNRLAFLSQIKLKYEGSLRELGNSLGKVEDKEAPKANPFFETLATACKGLNEEDSLKQMKELLAKYHNAITPLHNSVSKTRKLHNIITSQDPFSFKEIVERMTSVI